MGGARGKGWKGRGTAWRRNSEVKLSRGRSTLGRRLDKARCGSGLMVSVGTLFPPS
uniref:Uncharacterized protein n=2 Tax=Arundo donax TaxID=35708 RepID=A0A0A8Z1H4_ARUDO